MFSLNACATPSAGGGTATVWPAESGGRNGARRARLALAHKDTELVVWDDLDEAARPDFERACRRLLRSAGPEIAIDLTRADFVSTGYVFYFSYVNCYAQRTGRSLRISVQPRHATLFNDTSLRQQLDVRREIVGTGVGVA